MFVNYRDTTSRSHSLGRAEHNHRKVNVIRVPIHKLTNLGRASGQEFLFSTFAVVNWALLESIQFINPSIFRDKGNEVRVAL